ncbi:MAG: hypothetical protein JO074_02745 [Frankiales bacterium]|nr:hypothetical protein [Frankiales bacterium]
MAELSGYPQLSRVPSVVRAAQSAHDKGVSVPPSNGDGGDATDAPLTAYLVLTLRLSEEAGQVPVIEVIRAVRNAAVSLAASRGEQPEIAEVEQVVRRRLGIAG